MKFNRITIIIVCIGALIVLGLLFWWLSGRQQTGGVVIPDEARGVKGSPIDVTLDFYDSWLSAKQSSTTDPYAQNLANATVLSTEMSKRLTDSKSKPRGDGNDPVLCQPTVPSGLRSKLVFEKGDSAQILVYPKYGQPSTQAVVTLAAHDSLWEITDINCVTGDQAPAQGEFSFDTEGRLLKKSVPPPLDPKYWYLVFEQSGTPGYTVPLLFDDSSVCVPKGGKEEACRDDLFTESVKVHVQGDMTETGVTVKKIEILE